MITGGNDDDEQRIMLVDFGIARAADDISGLTATNMAVAACGVVPVDVQRCDRNSVHTSPVEIRWGLGTPVDIT